MKLVDRTWQRTGKPVPMVSQYSATNITPGDHKIFLDGDHSEMVKLARQSLGYQMVRNRLLGLITEAPEAIKKIFEESSDDSM
jgi:hypothetical protein